MYLKQTEQIYGGIIASIKAKHIYNFGGLWNCGTRLWQLSFKTKYKFIYNKKKSGLHGMSTLPIKAGTNAINLLSKTIQTWWKYN